MAALDVEERRAAVVDEQLVGLRPDLGDAAHEVAGGEVEVLPPVEVEVVEPGAPRDRLGVRLLQRAADAGLGILVNAPPSLRSNLLAVMLDSARSRSPSRSTSPTAMPIVFIQNAVPESSDTSVNFQPSAGRAVVAPQAVVVGRHPDEVVRQVQVEPVVAVVVEPGRGEPGAARVRPSPSVLELTSVNVPSPLLWYSVSGK